MGNPSASASITIGTLSRATGIPISTIRTWERRYGFPVPIRTQGNQRKYEVTAIEHLKLINSALERGMRAGQVVPLSLAELSGLLTTVPEIEDEQQRLGVVEFNLELRWGLSEKWFSDGRLDWGC